MKNFIIITALTGLSILASCSRDDNPSSINPNRITLTTCVDMAVETKSAITDGVFPTTRDMYVAAYNNTTSSNHFTSTRFTYSSGSWVADKLWPLSGTLDFLAYSMGSLTPSGISWGSPNLTSSVQLTMPDNSSAQEDILFGCAVGKSSGSDAALTFTHAQAYINFTAKASENYNSTTNKGITINSITLQSAKYAGTVIASRSGSTLTYNWLSLSSAKQLAVPGISSEHLSTTAAAVGSGVLLPEQTEVGFVINYTLHDGKDSSGNKLDTNLSYTWTPSLATTWQSGKLYTYSITVNLKNITITPSVSTWTSGATQEIKL